MTSRLKLWLGLFLLFGAGALTGIVATCFFMDSDRTHRANHGPAAQHERIMKRLSHELSLTAAQQAEIEPVVRRAHVAILELRFSHQAEIEKILTAAMAELQGKLAPAQQPQLERMYKGLEQRWQASREYMAAQKKG